MREEFYLVYSRINKHVKDRPWLIEAVVLLVFMAFAILFHVGRNINAPEVLDLCGDAANIASFAAAWDHPELFEGDMALGDQKNFRFYATVHIPLIRLMQRVTGNYGYAYTALAGAHVFLHLAGFYIFGRLLIRSRFWSFVLAWALLPKVPVGWYTAWGIWQDPLPRMSFSALLGFLWAATLYWRKRPFAWPWIMVSAGLMMYVHPVSAPTIALAVWMGLWSHKPEQWSQGKRFGYMVFCGFCFLVVTIPFIANYSVHREHVQAADLEQVREILEFRFAPGFIVDRALTMKNFIVVLCRKTPLIPLSVMGAILLIWVGNENERRLLNLFLLWGLGIAISSIGIFLLDYLLARIAGRLPALPLIVRGVRFFVPLLIVITVASLMVIEDRVEGLIGSRIALVTLMVLAFFLIRGANPAITIPKTGAKRVLFGIKTTEGDPAYEYNPYSKEAIMAVRRLTPPKARMLVYDFDELELAVRYGALRPVVYSWRDSGVLSYANHKALFKWLQTQETYQEIRENEDQVARSNDLLGLAETLDAEYLLINLDEIPSEYLSDAGEETWSNERYSLIRLSERQTAR
jgi:hypothetical protein